MANNLFAKKIKNLIEYVSESETINRVLFLVILGVTFMYMLFLNTKTPLIANAIIFGTLARRGSHLGEFVPLASQNGMYGLKDVQMDPNHWVNRALANYFGVSNIGLKP